MINIKEIDKEIPIKGFLQNFESVNEVLDAIKQASPQEFDRWQESVNQKGNEIYIEEGGYEDGLAAQEDYVTAEQQKMAIGALSAVISKLKEAKQI